MRKAKADWAKKFSSKLSMLMVLIPVLSVVKNYVLALDSGMYTKNSM